MFIHVPAAWMALVGLSVRRGRERCRAGVAPSARRDRGAGGGADRRRLHPRLPRDRVAVGPADVGHLVGVGRAADLGAGAVLSLSRLYRAGERVRRSGARRARRVGAGAGRGGQPADHQVLGRLVEHAAPAGERRARSAARRSTSRCCCRCWSWRSGSCCCSRRCCWCGCAPRSTSARPRALRLHGRAGAAPRTGRRARRRRCDDRDRASGSRWAATPAFVWPAYAAARSSCSAGCRVQSWRRYRRERGRTLDRLQRPAGTAPMTRKQRRLLALVAAGWRLLGGGDRAGAGRVQRQSRVLLQPERAGRERRSAPGRRVRIGGLVEAQSLAREADGRSVSFRVTDGKTDIAVVYDGMLPDLFREGQGVVAEGRLRRRRRLRRQQRARQARREIHAARGRRCAEEKPGIGRKAATPARSPANRADRDAADGSEYA